MDLASFDIAQFFQTPAPLFVRKVDRATHWGTADDILANVFPLDTDGTISVWKIENLRDLQLIAIALNSNRVATNPQGSLTEKLTLVAISPEELTGISVLQAAGLTECSYARSRHYNINDPSNVQREELVNRLLSLGRRTANLSKGFMKAAREVAESARCHAVENHQDFCGCEHAAM